MTEPTSQRAARWLIAMKGHPATGKSTLAQALAQHCDWPLIDKDDIKDHLLAAPGGNEVAYSVLWQVVERQLALGISVIADSPLSYPAGYAAAQALADRYHAELLVVETRLEEREWRRRLEGRPAGESAHKIQGWARMQQQLHVYDGCWQYGIAPAHHLVVDAGRPLSQLVAQVESRMQGNEESEKQRIERRRQLLTQELERYVRLLCAGANPEKVIVFGSFATGKIHEWSDLDLVIVRDTDLPFLQRMREIRSILQPQVAVELLCYTPQEFAQLCAERRFFQDEILRKGKVLYARAN